VSSGPIRCLEARLPGNRTRTRPTPLPRQSPQPLKGAAQSIAHDASRGNRTPLHALSPASASCVSAPFHVPAAPERQPGEARHFSGTKRRSLAQNGTKWHGSAQSVSAKNGAKLLKTASDTSSRADFLSPPRKRERPARKSRTTFWSQGSRGCQGSTRKTGGVDNIIEPVPISPVSQGKAQDLPSTEGELYGLDCITR
jgi:hypothetical protein